MQVTREWGLEPELEEHLLYSSSKKFQYFEREINTKLLQKTKFRKGKGKKNVKKKSAEVAFLITFFNIFFDSFCIYVKMNAYLLLRKGLCLNENTVDELFKKITCLALSVKPTCQLVTYLTKIWC